MCKNENKIKLINCQALEKASKGKVILLKMDSFFFITEKGASPQGSIHHQMVSESWNFTGRAQMCALRQKCF